MRKFKISSVRFFLPYFLLLKLGWTSAEQTCSECFQNLGLEWCTNKLQLNTSIFTRCLKNTNQLTEWSEWCGEEFIYHPSNNVKTLLNDPFTDPANSNTDEKVVQIKPQLVEMDLAPGKTESLTVRFKYVKGYALELYYLMDMSKSMEQDKRTIVQLADDLASELKKLTPDLKLGFGSFLDKIMLPYVNTHSSWLENPCFEEETKTCRRPYGYQNILSLTNDTDEFINSVNNAKLSTNWDDPEGGLDALIQAMACKEIGWQTTTSRHLIVYVSGSAFKYAGDGKLAGLTKANDMQCHLDSDGMYELSSVLDYPSISQIEQVSKDKRIYVIFAVKNKVLPLYTALSKLILQSEASELKEDSSNIIDIITNIYEDISRTLILTDDSYKYPDLKLSYSSKCGKDKQWQEGSQCEDVDINEEIQFKIDFQLTKCLPKDKPITIKIFPQGLEDEMVVKVFSNCECECENLLNSVNYAKQCLSRGKFACGVCMCHEGYSGEHCECEKEVDPVPGVNSAKCKRPDDLSGRDCSGHGVCKCGICECHRRVEGNPNSMYQGKFCECSNFDCPKWSGLMCSKNGRCECSKCICYTGWKGDDCSCDTRQNNCINAGNKNVCSGNGDCICNQCKCNSLKNDATKKYLGKYCEDCESCEGRCGLYNECIQCKVSLNGPLISDCERQCKTLEIIQVEDIEETNTEKRCSYKNEERCLVVSGYNPTTEGVVYVQKEPNCSGIIKFYVVIGGMIALVLLVGLVLLLIWKCWVTIKDNREYNKFLHEYQKSNFSQQLNPIYQDPITRVTNPMRGVDN